jgi:UDP-2,3-diacylglucosamine hydrolase
VSAVLGTRIETVAGDPARPVLLLSDLHIPADGGAVVEALSQWLDQAVSEGARVFVLGDLFDSYVSAAQVRTGVWREIAARFATAVGRGVEMTVLHGNRDFLLGTEFARASGVRLVAGGVRTRIGAREVLLLHGDELCQNDVPYQRAKRWLRSWPVRLLARRLPLSLALRVADRARSKSSMVIQSGDQTRFDPTAAAIGAALAGVDQLVFGHIHRPARGRYGAGEYCVLPAFDAAGVGIRMHGQETSYVRCTARGVERLPDPAPRQFA